MRSDRAARANVGGSGVGAAWFPIGCATRRARRLESRGNELGWRRPAVAFHPPRWSVRACLPGRVRGGVLAGSDPSATGIAFSPACGAGLAQQPGALRRKNDPVTASHDDVECLQTSRQLRKAPAIGEAELPADRATQRPPARELLGPRDVGNAAHRGRLAQRAPDLRCRQQATQAMRGILVSPLNDYTVGPGSPKSAVVGRGKARLSCGCRSRRATVTR